MKLFATLLAASALAVPSSVLAASPANTLSVHVPFAFVMAGQQFDAGDYRVHQSDNGVICVQGEGKAAMAISVPSSTAKPGAPSSLQFSKDDEQEHLVGVQWEGAEIRMISKHSPERRLTLTSAR